MDDLIALGEGKLDPMTAVMTGALGLSATWGWPWGCRGKMQALFSKLQVARMGDAAPLPAPGSTTAGKAAPLFGRHGPAHGRVE